MKQLVTVCPESKEKGYKCTHTCRVEGMGGFCPCSENSWDISCLGEVAATSPHFLSLLTQHIAWTDGSGPINNTLGQEERRYLNKDNSLSSAKFRGRLPREKLLRLLLLCKSQSCPERPVFCFLFPPFLK